MSQDTKAFRFVKTVYYILAVVFAVFIEFISTRLEQSDPFKDLLHDAAIAIVLAVIGVYATFLTRRLLDSHTAETNKVAEVTGIWKDLGIVNMVTEWQDFRAPTGVGLEFRNRLRQFYQDATWYIITINPVGLAGEFLYGILFPALESGIKLKWTYVRLPDKDDIKGQSLRDFWASQYVAWTSDFEKNLAFARENLSNNLNELKVLTQQKIERGEIPPGSLEIYESQVTTTFLALLAVKNRGSSVVASPGKRFSKDELGIVLVNPYTMFPMPNQHHWGVLLVSPGELYKQYAASIIRFFEVGQSEGYLHRVWPEK